ncbi:hypothetical protein PHYC_01685 [Phycisphaerales bacterium]|nr:hypothetical protein PHYC_01685 [Phycisphaerales bacterium]
MIALRASMLLRENGIPAWISAPDIMPPFETGVFVGGESFVRPAREILAATTAESLTPETGWESTAAPDIRRLDASLAPDCPGCGRALPMDPGLTQCPACGTPANVTERLLERHGPEVFVSLYPDDSDDAPEAALANCHVVCQCTYPLDGLGTTGRCPECGAPFDKRVVLGWAKRSL